MKLRLPAFLRSLVAIAAVSLAAVGLPAVAVASHNTDGTEAQAVALAYVQALHAGKWMAACSLLNRDLFDAERSSIVECARGCPSTLNVGTGFIGFIRRGTATVRATHAVTPALGRARVYVLWRVYPWRRDAITVFLLDREYDHGQQGSYRISGQEWAHRQWSWPIAPGRR